MSNSTNINPNSFDIRRLNSLEKQNYDLRNIIQIGRSLSSNLDFSTLVESILYSCIGQMFIEKVAILLQVDIDINSFYIHTAKGYEQSFADKKVILAEDSDLVHYFFENPNPIEYNVLVQNADLHADLRELDMLEPELIIPMKARDGINGVIVLGPKINGGSFSSEEQEFVKELSYFAAIAVENSRLYLMATLDRMTRLYIHQFFQQRLLEEMKRSLRHDAPLSLIITDIDHFKKFNDTYGHQQGDIVLKETAKLFNEFLRKIDIAARYGGEEFAVVLPETTLDGAIIVANRLRKRIEDHEYPGQEKPLHVTISMGVAQYDPERDFDKSFLIERADKAMYRAKESGRNRVAAFR